MTISYLTMVCFCSRMFLLWGSNIWQIRWRRSELYILYLWFYICFCWKWMTNNKTFHFHIIMFFAHLYSADPSLWGILTWPSARWASAGAPPLLEIRTQSGGGSAETDNTWGIKNDLLSHKSFRVSLTFNLLSCSWTFFITRTPFCLSTFIKLEKPKLEKLSFTCSPRYRSALYWVKFVLHVPVATVAISQHRVGRRTELFFWLPLFTMSIILGLAGLWNI